MTASCASSDLHWLRWLPLSRCSDSHVSLQTDRSGHPHSHDQPEGLAGQALRSTAVEAADADAAASAAVRLDAGNVDQGYRTADHQEAADEAGRATLSDENHTAGAEGSPEVACDGREGNLHRWASADQAVQSRSFAEVDAQGGMRLNLAMAEVGTHHNFHVAEEALGSRSGGDDM